MILKIDHKHLELIKAYGLESYPNECCGFLLGKQNIGEKEVQSTLPAFNAREGKEQYHRFLITSRDYLQGEKFARERGMDIIGFYHSHPDAKARPSHYDLEHGWPWYSYLIVSVKKHNADEVTSWVLKEDRSK
ncbi:MAG: M67 family metallopeptidase, partial [bacterium]